MAVINEEMGTPIEVKFGTKEKIMLHIMQESLVEIKILLSFIDYLYGLWRITLLTSHETLGRWNKS